MVSDVRKRHTVEKLELRKCVSYFFSEFYDFPLGPFDIAAQGSVDSAPSASTARELGNWEWEQKNKRAGR